MELSVMVPGSQGISSEPNRRYEFKCHRFLLSRFLEGALYKYPESMYCYVAMSARNTRLSFRLGLRTCLLDLAYVEACCSKSLTQIGGYVRCQAEGRRHVRWGSLFMQLPLIIIIIITSTIYNWRRNTAM